MQHLIGARGEICYCSCAEVQSQRASSLWSMTSARSGNELYESEIRTVPICKNERKPQSIGTHLMLASCKVVVHILICVDVHAFAFAFELDGP
jgi:hypothetical protein